MTYNTDWVERILGDIGETLIGLTYSPSQVGINGDLVLRSSNIQNGALDLRDTVRVTADVPARIRVQRSDILICVRNGSRSLIGKSLLLDQRVEGETFGAFMAVFRSPLNEYLSFFFQSDDFKRQVDEHLGATINQITNRSLKSFKVLIPPAADRAKVTTALADISELIQQLESLVAKKQWIKQGMLQNLLTGRTRLPGFVGEWSAITFGEVATISRDRVSPWEVEGRVVELEHLASGTGILLGDADVRSAVSLKTVFIEGDVLFGKLRAYLRKYWLADRGGYCSTEIWALRARPGVSLGSYLRFIVEMTEFIDTASTAYGTHMPRSDWRVVSQFEFDLPPIDEQRAIAEVLRDVDREIEALERRMKSARAIKQGMMQELITGRTRLTSAEVAA